MSLKLWLMPIKTWVTLCPDLGHGQSFQKFWSEDHRIHFCSACYLLMRKVKRKDRDFLFFLSNQIIRHYAANPQTSSCPFKLLFHCRPTYPLCYGLSLVKGPVFVNSNICLRIRVLRCVFKSDNLHGRDAVAEGLLWYWNARAISNLKQASVRARDTQVVSSCSNKPMVNLE